MKKTIFKKPTIFQLTIGLLVSIGQSMFTKKGISVPVTVGKYRLVSVVEKEILNQEYGIGVYEYMGEKVFIKTWSGRIENFRYYSLVKECLINEALYRKMEENKSLGSKYLIKVPRVIGYMKKRNSLSVVFEYIHGKTLTSSSFAEQTEVIAAIIKALYSVSKSFTDKEKKQFSIRPFIFYIFSLPLFTLLTVILNFRSSKSTLKALFNCLKTIDHIKVKNLYLVHGDLDLHNVIKNKSGYYLLDCERMIITIPNYDVTYMSLYPHLRQLTKLVCKQLNQTPNIFIKNYLSIQLAKSFDYRRRI